MREVAEELNISESSVSRTVNGKFMASDKGIIRLKTFFAHGFKSEFGSRHSVHTVIDKIKSIINSESKDKPFSDQKISDKLKELGIQISRRTIRNYRDELHIASSSQRKKKYKINI
jgi:RNA polymerase sigma-54 factor